MKTSQDIDTFNYARYENDIPVERLAMHKETPAEDHFRQLIDIRLHYLRSFAAGQKVLDIGCGTGDYLFEIREIIASGCGVDYTEKAVGAAQSKKAALSAANLEFMKANARQLPLTDATFGLVYSFSALACIPDVHEVVAEVGRVLAPGGVAVLEFGNLRSLNTFVCQAHPELAATCHVTTGEMRRAVRKAGLTVIEWRAFGLLPYWADRPKWLQPFLHPAWKRVMQTRVFGRMLDEWASNTFVFRPWAYRHFVMARKMK